MNSLLLEPDFEHWHLRVHLWNDPFECLRGNEWMEIIVNLRSSLNVSITINESGRLFNPDWKWICQTLDLLEASFSHPDFVSWKGFQGNNCIDENSRCGCSFMRMWHGESLRRSHVKWEGSEQVVWLSDQSMILIDDGSFGKSPVNDFRPPSLNVSEEARER